MNKHSILKKVLLIMAVLFTAVVMSIGASALGSELGDVNADGKVAGNDSTALLKYLADWDIAINSDNADGNFDGKVGGGDVTALLKYLAYYDSKYINDKETIFLQKDPDKDFNILTLTDPQFSLSEVGDEHWQWQLLKGTISQLVESEDPDLIIVCGDMGNGPEYEAVCEIFKVLDSFGIPWTVAWGNHDNQSTYSYISELEIVMRRHKNCMYMCGDRYLGNGNFEIIVREGYDPVEAVFIMDTHDKMDSEAGMCWATLYPQQLEWYEKKVRMLKENNCNDSSIFVHIPIYGYNKAFEAAISDIGRYRSMSVQEVIDNPDIWNEGYEDSFGNSYEPISSFSEDEEYLEAIIALGHTHNMVCGHDHVNSTSIKYQGVRLTYCLKWGMGGYWNGILNGGTVLKVGHDGIYDVYHHLIDPGQWPQT